MTKQTVQKKKETGYCLTCTLGLPCPDFPKKTMDSIFSIQKPKNKKCTSCGKKKSDVRMRSCGYFLDLYDTKKMHRVCDDCEAEHNRDI